MKRTLQKLTVAMTSAVMALSGTVYAGELPEWLNNSGDLPIVEEGTEKTLKIAVKLNIYSISDIDIYFSLFIVSIFPRIKYLWLFIVQLLASSKVIVLSLL